MLNRSRYVGTGVSNNTWSTCTATTELGGFCDATVPPGSPVSSCGVHLMAAFRFCEELLGTISGDHYERFSEYDRRNRLTIDRSVVYYVRIGDEIKIGTSAHLRARMGNLKPDEILGVEHGARQLEVQRHEQFAHLKVPGRRKEFFRPGPDLLAFIAALDPSLLDASMQKRKRSAEINTYELLCRIQ